MQVVVVARLRVVPRAGVEPARPFGQRILSPQRLPFRHPGMLSVTLTIPKNFLFALSHQNRDAYVDEPKMSPRESSQSFHTQHRAMASANACVIEWTIN